MTRGRFMNRPYNINFTNYDAIICQLEKIILSNFKEKEPRLRLFSHFSYPIGFCFCQFQASRHISAKVFSAFHSSFSALFPGSA